MTVLASVLGRFRPAEWNEESYVRGPPFVSDTVGSRLCLVPRDTEVGTTLESLTSALGLKKAARPVLSYVVSKPSAGRVLREFDWLVRRSWREPDISVLWSVIYLGEAKSWARSDISLQMVADLAGVSWKECGQSLAKLFHARYEDGEARALGDYAGDKKLVEVILEGILNDLPTPTEEEVMGVLCSSAGGSAGEIQENIPAQGLSVGAIYKVLEKLKAEGFVYPSRYFRVNERGPMRELLSADCQNCFYGFTSSDMCLRDTLRQLEWVMKRDYGKTCSRGEQAAMYSSMKCIPYSSRTNRRVLASLELVSEIDRILGEGGVSDLLRTVEEHYGVEFPIRGAVADSQR